MKHYERVIPRGMYCYEGSRNPASKTYKPCVFWSINKKKAERYESVQAAGYCGFLKSGDWMRKAGGLLFDQVKECGINYDDKF